MRKRAPAYTLTSDLLAQFGGPVLCLDHRAVGRHYRLHASYPGPAMNVPLWRDSIGLDIIEPTGATISTQDVESAPPLIRVDIRGPIEQRAGLHECEGYSDGHDAIAERLCAALETSDVFLVIDSPGGAHAGMQEAVRLVLQMKAKHGRRITVQADEMIGSAAYWWAACIGDEIFTPESGQIGSIGARAGHQSMAGHLAKEGIETTYFAWPGSGKVAFAPELPLSDLGRMRGDRDVADAGEAFARAVGPRRGLTRDDIVALDADVLSGHRAVKARLADSVASMDEVLAYALALAERNSNMSGIRNEDPSKDPKSPEQARAEEPQRPGHPEPDGDEGTEDEGDEEQEPTPPERDKYCSKCGGKMRYEDEDPEQEDSSDEDEPERRAPPPDQDRAASIAAIFGLHTNASLPAVKTVAMSYAKLGRAVMAATSSRTPERALGALRALVDDAKEVASKRAEVAAIRAKAEKKERMDLLRKLAGANLPGYPRGDLLVDEEVNGKLITKPAGIFASTPLAELRGFVEGKTKGITVVSRNPYQPDANKAKDAQTTQRVEVAKDSKLVEAAATRSTSSKDRLAQTAAALEAAGAFNS